MEPLFNPCIYKPITSEEDMVATLLFMPAENDSPPLCAPPQASHDDVLTAQKAALEAQQTAEKAQREAIAMQESEGGIPVKTDDERLAEASKAVLEADRKLIEHLLKP